MTSGRGMLQCQRVLAALSVVAVFSTHVDATPSCTPPFVHPQPAFGNTHTTEARVIAVSITPTGDVWLAVAGAESSAVFVHYDATMTHNLGSFTSDHNVWSERLRFGRLIEEHGFAATATGLIIPQAYQGAEGPINFHYDTFDTTGHLIGRAACLPTTTEFLHTDRLGRLWYATRSYFYGPGADTLVIWTMTGAGCGARRRGAHIDHGSTLPPVLAGSATNDYFLSSLQGYSTDGGQHTETTSRWCHYDSTGTRLWDRWRLGGDTKCIKDIDASGTLLVLGATDPAWRYMGRSQPPRGYDVFSATGDSIVHCAIADSAVWTLAVNARCSVVIGTASAGQLWTTDADADGLCDTWEIAGLAVAADRPNVALSGACPWRRDMFVEVTAMHNRAPDASVYSACEMAFAAIPNDQLQPPNPSGQNGIGLHFEVISSDATFTTWNASWQSLLPELRRRYFSRNDTLSRDAKALAYRFCVFGDRNEADPREGASVIGGRDIAVTLGGLYDRNFASAAVQAGRKRDVIAGTLMHELGHLMGLQDGGGDGINYKPNYHSVMNYMWSAPRPYIGDWWRLAYSTRAFRTLDETDLDESLGIDGDEGDKVLIGPPKRCPGSNIAVPENERGPIDYTCNNNATDSHVHQAIHYIGAPDQVDERNTMRRLTGYSDIPLLRLTVEEQGVAFDRLVLGRTYASAAPTYAMLQDCNNNGVADAEDIEADAGLDADRDWKIDTCEPARITITDTTLTLCPAGDADSLDIRVTLKGIWGIDPSLARVFALCSLPTGVHMWDAGTGSEVRDTLWALSRDLTAQSATLRVRAGSGVGRAVLDVHVDDMTIARGLGVHVRGFDQDDHGIGVVDRYDSTRVAGDYGTAQTRSDFNWSGTVNGVDLGVLANHRASRHSIARRLKAPNGGETLLRGSPTVVRWQKGLGDSARASLLLYRDATPQIVLSIASNVADVGSYSWGVPSGLPSGSDYRIVVVHTVGRYRADVPDAGRDTSDQCFTVSAGSNGCPFVDTRTSAGWFEENSVLGRTLGGGPPPLDVYQLTSVPTVVDELVALRIREDEEEVSEIDRVRLVAVDHPLGTDVARVDGEYVVGTWHSPYQIEGPSGDDLTQQLGTPYGYYQGDEGDTLLVWMHDPYGGEVDSGGNAVIIAPGGKGGRGELMARGATGPLSSEVLNENILRTTGILVQQQDTSGVWETVRRIYPREFFAQTAIDTLLTDPIRLVFVGHHALRGVGWLEPSGDSAAVQELPLVTAVHSRTGDVQPQLVLGGGDGLMSDGDELVQLVTGDTLSMEFAVTPPDDGEVRDYMLLAEGTYTTDTGVMPLRGGRSPVETPLRFALGQNRPNPFGMGTKIGFDLPRSAHVRLEVFDLQGRRVQTVADRDYGPGHWDATWNRRGADGGVVPSGVYLYRMTAGKFRSQRKMVLLP